MNDYWFFLSYSRRDADGDGYLGQFYKDLANEVAKKLGLPSHMRSQDFAFYDQRNIEPGDEWPEILAEGLQSSKVMVCLYSPGYFNSSYCGKELTIFKSRIQAYYTKQGKYVPAIIPIIWEHPTLLPRKMPEILSDIQFMHTDFGERYAQEGLRQLMKLNRYRDEYRNFVSVLALKLVNIARNCDIPRLDNLLPLRLITNPFIVTHSTQASTEPTQPDGPLVAQFAYVVGCREELKQQRQKLDYYGDSGYMWRPYYPDNNEIVGLLCQRVATDEKLYYEMLLVNEQLVNQIRNAEAKNKIVVCIVDPWTIRLEVYKTHMSKFDENNFLNCVVVIPWNHKDEETTFLKNDLQNAIETTFQRYATHELLLRNLICSADELYRELCIIISEIRSRLLKRAKPLRSLGGTPTASMPVISGELR